MEAGIGINIKRVFLRIPNPHIAVIDTTSLVSMVAHRPFVSDSLCEGPSSFLKLRYLLPSSLHVCCIERENLSMHSEFTRSAFRLADGMVNFPYHPTVLIHSIPAMSKACHPTSWTSIGGTAKVGVPTLQTC